MPRGQARRFSIWISTGAFITTVGWEDDRVSPTSLFVIIDTDNGSIRIRRDSIVAFEWSYVEPTKEA